MISQRRYSKKRGIYTVTLPRDADREFVNNAERQCYERKEILLAKLRDLDESFFFSLQIKKILERGTFKGFVITIKDE